MYIALCGAPGAGKTTVQTILKDEFGVEPVDDGRVLRDIAIQCFGLTEDQVYTIEGKRSYINFLDQEWQIRQILGEIGRSLENLFSEHIVPHLTVQKYCTDPSKNYSFGSVRRSQPEYFNKVGGLVVEILRDGCVSKYDFDEYHGRMDLTIENDGTLDELRSQIKTKFQGILT
jgi:dephospho-CoA kinase